MAVRGTLRQPLGPTKSTAGACFIFGFIGFTGDRRARLDGSTTYKVLRPGLGEGDAVAYKQISALQSWLFNRRQAQVPCAACVVGDTTQRQVATTTAGTSFGEADPLAIVPPRGRYV